MPGGGDGHGGAALAYEVVCVWDQPSVTEVMRVPLMLPPRASGDDSVLCKLIVIPDSVKLEGRQRPIVVGNIPELGNWDPSKGVKLMRQAGGHWTCRVGLPLTSATAVQAKVVICDANAGAVAWEPGTVNRSFALVPGVGPHDHMLVFTCQWSNPGVTPVLPMPVQYESKVGCMQEHTAWVGMVHVAAHVRSALR